MDSIAFLCPGCSKQYDVPVEVAGKLARCKACGTSFRVPEASPRPTVDAGPAPDPYGFDEAEAVDAVDERMPLPSIRHRATARAAHASFLGDDFSVGKSFFFGLLAMPLGFLIRILVSTGVTLQTRINRLAGQEPVPLVQRYVGLFLMVVGIVVTSAMIAWGIWDVITRRRWPGNPIVSVVFAFIGAILTLWSIGFVVIDLLGGGPPMPGANAPPAGWGGGQF